MREEELARFFVLSSVAGGLIRRSKKALSLGIMSDKLCGVDQVGGCMSSSSKEEEPLQLSCRLGSIPIWMSSLDRDVIVGS